MISFRTFFESTEEQQNIRDTLSRLPKSHRELIKGYRYEFQDGNTLRGDNDNVGYIDPEKKEIAIAAPWNYGREFTLLHELGHRVWAQLSPKWHRRWRYIVANTKHKQNQPPEELFCMAYACYYAKNKITIHDHPAWHKFISGLPN